MTNAAESKSGTRRKSHCKRYSAENIADIILHKTASLRLLYKTI